MNRLEQIRSIELLLQQLRAEEQIENWLKDHPDATEVIERDSRGVWVSVAIGDQKVAMHKGVNIVDARGQAFTAIFANEAAERGENHQ